MFFLVAVIYLAFISLGLPDSLLGSAWPVIRTELGCDVSLAGYVTMVVSFCTVVSSLFSQRLVKKIGDNGVIFASIVMTGLAMIGYSLSKSYFMLVLLAVPYGLGAGAIDAVLNNYVALHLSSNHMSWLHCFWGLGATISPNIMSFALSRPMGWRGGYIIVAVAQFVIGAIILISTPLWKKADVVYSAEDPVDQKILSPLATFKLKGAPLIFIAFFCYCFFESVPIVWSATYFKEVYSLDADTAASFASMFFIGITASRGFCGTISNKIGDRRLIRIGGIAVICSAIFAAIRWQSYVPSLIAFVLIGIGCGPIYPSIIHSAPTDFGKEYSGAVISLEMACAYIGNTVSPVIMGNIIKFFGAETVPYIIILMAIIMFALIEIFNKKIKT